jgi:hypothetical protein
MVCANDGEAGGPVELWSEPHQVDRLGATETRDYAIAYEIHDGRMSRNLQRIRSEAASFGETQ